MKKLSNAITYAAILLLLIGWLLFHFHFLDAGKVKALLLTAVMFSVIGAVIKLIDNAKKAKKTGLQKVSSIIMYFSAFGVIIAMMLIVFHLQHFGRPLLNFSLILFIAGVVVLMISMLNAKNTVHSPVFKQQSIIINNSIVCL